MPKPFIAAFLFVLGALLLAPGTILAESGDDPDEENLLQEVVVTGERSPEDASRSARAVSVVTGDEISNRMSRTVPESLRYEQGILVQRTNLGGGAPFIRGMVGNQVLYLVDGVRVNNSTFRGGPNQYLNTIDPFFIDQIEVVRGPGSVLYGSDALGGTINVITRRRKNFEKPFGLDGRLMGRFTTADREQTAHLDIDANAGLLAGITASGNFRKFGDIDPGGDEPLQAPYGYEEQNFAGNVDFHIGDRLVWQFSAQHVNLDDVPNYDPGNPKNTFEPQRRNLFYSKFLVNDLSPYLDRVILSGSYHRQLEGREKIKADDPDIEIRDLDLVQTWGGGLQLETPIADWVRFIYGGEFYSDDIGSEREQEVLSTGKVTKNLDPQFPDDSTFSNAGAYLEARVTPFDWMKLVPGVRYSYFQPNIEMDDPTVGAVTVDDPITDVTWAFHSLFTVADHHGLVLGASRGFRVPSVDDFSKLGSEDGRFDIPNSELDPETLIQYEAGYRLAHPRAFVSLFGFYSQIENLITRKPSTYEGQEFIGPDRVNKNENLGEALIYGGEFSAKLIVLEDFITTGGAASYTFGHNETDDEPLRRIPPLLGNAFLRIGTDYVWVEGAMEAAAKQDRLSAGDKDDARIGPGGTPAFTVYHVRLGLLADDWIEAIIAVENISDIEYKYHGSGPLEPGRNYKTQISFLF